MDSVKNLIIFENPLHAKKVLKYQKDERTSIVSFSVAGKLVLEKKGIQCYYPDDLIELPDFNRIGRENIERVCKICDFLDDKLQEKIDLFRDNEMRLFSAGYYNIKIFFDALYTSYFILESLLNKLNAEKITVFKENYCLNRLIMGSESIVPALVENVFCRKYNNIEIVSHTSFNFKRISLSKIKDSGKNFVKRVLNTNGRRKYRSNSLILIDTHDIPYVTDEVLDNVNFYKLYLQDKSIALSSLKIFDSKIKKINGMENEYHSLVKDMFYEALRDDAYRDMFVEKDNLFCFANECLQDYLLQTVGNILSYTDYIKNWLIDLTPKIILTSVCRLSLLDAFVIELAKSLKIPVVTYQEGGGAGYLEWPMFDIDMKLSDYFLVYGNGVKEDLILKSAGPAKVIPVGSVRLTNIRKHTENKIIPKTTIYVVLDIIKIGIWQHYPYNGGFFSQAYKHQLKILDIFNQFKTIKFVLKTIKGREFLYEHLIDDHIQICVKPLVHILNEASAFILDWPSTCLQECLVTDKPIALFYDADSVKFERNALELLTRRVRMTSEPGEYYDVISSLIKDCEYGTGMAEEDEFVKKYCLMENAINNCRNFFDVLIKKPDVSNRNN